MTASLRDRLHAVIPALTPAERRVAEVLCSDPDGAARCTVTELAARADTSTASVLRTAKRLGYDGYPALRYALASQVGPTTPATIPATTVPQVADIVAADDAGTIVAKLAAYEIGQLTATADLLSASALEAAARGVAGADRRFAYGLGSSGLVARDLTQKLTRLGLVATACTDHDGALVSASLLGPGDVVVAVSHSGETPGSLDPARLARDRSATVVALTGSPRSSLARLADHVLQTAGAEHGPRAAAVGSRTSQLLAVDALFVRVAQLTPDAAAALQLTHAAIADARRRGR